MKKLTLFLFAIAMVLVFRTATFAKTLEVCITTHTNEQLHIINTYEGNGIWSMSGCYLGTTQQNQICWTISGTADAYADTFYCVMTNPSPNGCAVTYDYLVWRAAKTAGGFNGHVEQWCILQGESPGDVVWVSCKTIKDNDCSNVNGCGYAPNKNSTSSVDYVQSAEQATATDNGGLQQYFDLLKESTLSVSVSPNPASSNATVNYNITETSNTQVTVYNSLGQVVKVLANGNQTEGTYTINWNLTDQRGASVPKGNYFIRIQSGNNAETQSFSVGK